MKIYDDDIQGKNQQKPLYPSRCLSISLWEMEEADKKRLLDERARGLSTIQTSLVKKGDC
jgi:hypothetical protein